MPPTTVIVPNNHGVASPMAQSPPRSPILPNVAPSSSNKGPMGSKLSNLPRKKY
jgi:hypothetical protein